MIHVSYDYPGRETYLSRCPIKGRAPCSGHYALIHFGVRNQDIPPDPSGVSLGPGRCCCALGASRRESTSLRMGICSARSENCQQLELWASELSRADSFPRRIARCAFRFGDAKLPSGWAQGPALSWSVVSFGLSPMTQEAPRHCRAGLHSCFAAM